MLFSLTSPAFENNGTIPEKHTCDGINVNPHLSISNPPENTTSLALAVIDQSSLKPNWIHWLLWNIEPTIQEIFENSIPPKTTLGLNDFQDISWGGPCPPQETHHYKFILYALDVWLDLPTSATFEQFETAIAQHIITQTELNGYYQRPLKTL